MRTYFNAVLTFGLSMFTIGAAFAASNIVESNVGIKSAPPSGPTGAANESKEVFVNKYGFDPHKINSNARLLINCSGKPVTVSVYNAADKVKLVPFMTTKVEPGKVSAYLNCKDVKQGCLVRMNGYPPVATVPPSIVTFSGDQTETYYTNSDAIIKGCSSFAGVSRSQAKKVW